MLIINNHLYIYIYIYINNLLARKPWLAAVARRVLLVLITFNILASYPKIYV